MKAYPTELKVGDRVYRIRFVSSIRGCRKLGKGSTMGIHDPNRCEILLKKGMSTDDTLKTLFHELVHALQFEYKIKISHEDVYKFEEAIFDFLWANSDRLLTA